MQSVKSFTDILPTLNEANFDDIALELFHVQAENNSIYHSYLKHLAIDSSKITAIDQIPFLPIAFFKSHLIRTGNWEPEILFSSSGTTGSMTSQHAVFDLSFYLSHSQTLFESNYGTLQSYNLLALLPSYLEREGSSLIAMIDHFIKQSQSDYSGFYLNNQEELLQKIASLKSDKRKTLLWGVSFALLDLAERFEVDLSHCIVMETGGMKGRRKEWVRKELHQFLTTRFNCESIHSEYGMTELLSQAYSKNDGLYEPPKSIKVMIRDINDPFMTLGYGRLGAISIIDLANAHSCAFIETQDLGKLGQNGYFEVLGRMDNSDIRGCNLLVG